MRLLLLIAVPMIGVSVLAYQRIRAENDLAADALELAEDARVQRATAEVYGPAQIEQIALQGLAAIDEMDVPRDLVVAIAGVDFETLYNANRVKLDAALDALAVSESPRIRASSNLADQLSFVRGELNAQRTQSESFRAMPDEIRHVFTKLDDILADRGGTVALSDVVSATTSGTTADRAKLLALSQVLENVGERGTALLEALLDRGPASARGILEANARLDLSIENFESLLDDAEVARLADVTSLLKEPPAALTDALAGVPLSEQIDANYIQTSAGAVLDQIDFLDALEVYSNDFHDGVVRALDDQAVAAESAAFRTTLLLAATLAVSLAMLLFLTLSTLRPLRRLTRRAATISDGGFDVAPLPLHGPNDVRTLTKSMNDMMVTLHHVDHGISELAGGATNSLHDDLPGPIGVSLRQSFERLEDTNGKLQASQQLASAIVEQAADAIWTIDADGLITTANDASVALVGLHADDQIGQPLHRFLPRYDGEVTVEGPTGESARLLVASSDIDAGHEPLTTVIARDISERTRYEERLAYQAHHDALTGLPNRFALLERLSARPAGAAVAVMFIDLDGFKSVNDTQGHLAGDQLLTEVGKRLTSHVRPGDFVARLGGDEFVVIINDYASVANVVAFGYRLIQEVEQPFGDGDNVFALSASVGVAAFDNGLADAELTPLDAIRCADNAVYEAKRRGRGRVELFDARLRESIVQSAEVEIALRQAVRNDELELHLQPVLDIERNTFSSAEALVRWNRPGHGMVPPGDFIPIAERSSLIFEIGRWVILESCKTLKRWAEEDPSRTQKIAVNIAGSHLIDGNLAADLDAALLLTGADPTRLEFELTETQLMHDVERARDVLERVRSRGVTVAIDDFGTGYSSMAYLRQLPIDTLKIDRSFVSNVTEDGFDSTVIDALLTIGHALGLSVVAEGIECAEQLAYLASKGCDRAQGYHLARPAPIADAEALMWPHGQHDPLEQLLNI
jgi:diguanylate cyclase (GGDEF)-like protein